MGRKGIIAILVIVLIGWIAGTSYWYVCKIRKDCDHCQNCEEEIEVVEEIEKPEQIPTLEKPLFTLSDGESFEISNSDNVSFSKGKSDITIPDSLSSDFAKLAEFLNNNNQKTLNIEGLYSISEPSNSGIGLQRAESLKTFLIDNYGINTAKITTSSQEAQGLYAEGNSIIGALNYSVISLKPIQDEITEEADEEVVEEQTTSEEIAPSIESGQTNVDAKLLRRVKRSYTMYYAPNSDYLNTTTEIDKYFKYLTKYFKQNPDGLIEIKGYSDIEGSDSEIKIAGKQKARLVEKYLIKEHKMSPRNLRVTGSSLQSDQADVLGKAKNRKVVFSLKK